MAPLFASDTVTMRSFFLPRQKFGKCPRRESNPHLRFRKPLFYPLNYGDSWDAEQALGNPNRVCSLSPAKVQGRKHCQNCAEESISSCHDRRSFHLGSAAWLPIHDLGRLSVWSERDLGLPEYTLVKRSDVARVTIPTHLFTHDSGKPAQHQPNHSRNESDRTLVGYRGIGGSFG